MKEGSITYKPKLRGKNEAKLHLLEKEAHKWSKTYFQRKTMAYKRAANGLSGCVEFT